MYIILYTCIYWRVVELLYLIVQFLNPGRVLNRFSKDVGFLDDLLPSVFGEYFLVSYILTIV